MLAEEKYQRQYTHFLKFLVWNLARQNSISQRLIGKLGKVATKNIQRKYCKELFCQGESLLPATRYLRDVRTPTQVIVCQNKEEKEPDSGLVLLLNHLRIPYRVVRLKDIRNQNNPLFSELKIVFIQDIAVSEIPPSFFAEDISFQMIFFGKKYNRNSFESTIDCIADEPEIYKINSTHLFIGSSFDKFLSYNDGLRSNFSATIISAIKNNINGPVITGMLMPKIGLRIDDVTGENCASWLNPIIESGWKPNLGIFCDDFRRISKKDEEYISNLSNDSRVECSPHAFTSDRFIFFDYPNGKPFTKGEFLERWKVVTHLFKKKNIPISSVINPHFHVVSKACVEVFNEFDIKYLFTELEIGSMNRNPNSKSLPSGDPTCTTGQINNSFLQQIYSGDSCLDCNQKDSLYDFFMNNESSDKTDNHTAAKRIEERLKLSVRCGFPAFVTTHEYYLSERSDTSLTKLWEAVEGTLDNDMMKASLTHIGECCWDHTHATIESIKEISGDAFEITFSGSAKKNFNLNIWGSQKKSQIPVNAFEGRQTQIINLV